MSNDSNKSPRNLLIGLFSVLWLALALVGYYYTHKPFTVELATIALVIVWRFFIAGGMILLSGGIGEWILSKKLDLPVLTDLALQAALGAGILGLAVLLMGMTFGFRVIYFAVLLVVPGVLLRKHILHWLRGWTNLRSCFSSDRFIVALSLGCGLILIWTLALSLAPPLRFDALTYHLALPRSYLLHNNIAYSPDNMFWGMPQEAEMLYTFAMALAGTEAATVLGWGFGLLTFAGLLGYLKEKINLTAGWVTVSCLLGGSTLGKSLSFGYTEWLGMLFGLGVLVVFDSWIATGRKFELLLAGVLAGFALGTKYTAGQLILIGLVIILWDGIRKRNHNIISTLLLFGIIATLVSLPWWLKNWLATSNPFYPLLWPAGAMTPARLEHYKGTPWGSWLDMLILPWQVMVWGVEGGRGFSWSIGPLLLGFGTLSWIGWQTRGSEEKRLTSLAATMTVTGFVIWALASRWNGLLIQTRLYAAFFPAWAVLAGIGFDSVSKVRAEGIRFGRIGVVILLLVFAFNLIEIGGEVTQQAPFAVLSGNMSPAVYQTRNLGSYAQAMTALDELPSDSRVLMLWETRNLDCLPKCDPDETIDRWYDDSLKYVNADEVLAAWRAQGYTHILLNLTGREFIQENDGRISPENWNKLDTLLNNLPGPKTIAPGYKLYELNVK